MKTKTTISGVYDTAIGELPNETCMSIHAKAAQGALDNAGLAKIDIDGALCAYSFTEPHNMLNSVFCEYMGIQPAFSASVSVGGATACVMIMQAAALVESGMCKHVLVVTGDNRVTGMPPGGAIATLAQFGHPQFEQPYGMTIPAAYGLVARRYLHETGATLEHLAAIAVTTRRHAGRHPNAHKKDPITLDDVANSRVIASPLRLLDCCLISDGGAAVIVSGSDGSRDGPNEPVALLGTGQGHTHEHIFAAPSLTEFGCHNSAHQALSRAGLKPADIDVAEIYDSFTITLLIELESMGFFQKGEAGDAIANGALDLGGILPCNTHGGLLSYGAAGAAGGMFHVVEAVRQLRGQAGDRQVTAAETAFVHGDGGVLSAHCSLVLGKS